MSNSTETSFSRMEARDLYQRTEIMKTLVDRLVSDKDICTTYNLSRYILSYSSISKSRQRNHEHYRFNFIIFSNNTPMFLVKFYNDKNSNELLAREFQIHKTIYEKYENLRIPLPIKLFEIYGLNVMVEEVFEGKTLYQCFEEDSMMEHFHQFIAHANEIQMRLNENLIPSTFKDFSDEIHRLTSQFIALYGPTTSEQSLITHFVKLVLDRISNKSLYKRYTNGDFNSTNILLDGKNESILLDFELAEETHLYFLEWFQFIISIPVRRNIIDLHLKDYSEPIILNALLHLRQHKTSDNSIKLQWLLFYMKQFVIMSQVSEKAELDKLRNNLKFDLISLFTNSNTNEPELIRLVRISLFILKIYGVKGLFEAFVEKIRIKWFSSNCDYPTK